MHQIKQTKLNMNKSVLILAIVAFVIVIITVVVIVISGRKAKETSDARQAELIAALGHSQTAGGGGWGGAVSSLLTLGTQVYKENK